MPSTKKSRAKARMISEKIDAGRSAIQISILGMLQRGDQCGYILARELREKSEALDIQYGALYPLLERMEREGVIRGRWEDGRGPHGRHVYAITAAGRKRLQKLQTGWLQLVAQVKSLITIRT